MHKIEIRTRAKEEFIDITPQVQRVISSNTDQKIKHVLIFIPHTTAGLTINECADPTVSRDLLMALDRIVDKNWSYQHREGNAPAHVKASLLGSSLCLIVHQHRLVLGSWQGIFMVEFDGPRQRNIYLSFS